MHRAGTAGPILVTGPDTVMPRKPAPPATDHLRQQAAELAARFIREGGLGLPQARSKAARRLGIDPHPGNPALPSDRLVQQALHAQLALFSLPQRGQVLEEKRRIALEAMDFLDQFSPRLAGPVLDGTTQGQDPVILHLHPDAPEDVPLFLEQQRLPARQQSARVLLADGAITVPSWHLVVEDIDFQLWVLPAHALRQPPRQSSANPQPLERASASRLRALLAG